MSLPANPSIWTLPSIIQKVRNLTATSSDQLDDPGITKYINDYYSFAMPFEIKEAVELNFYDFKVFPNQDVYPAKVNFLTDQPMAYANGFPLIFYSDPDIFYQDWPIQYAQDAVATGDGLTVSFSGNTQAFPVIPQTFFITDGTQTLTDTGSNVVSEQIDTGDGLTASYSGTLNFIPIVAGSLSITNGVETFADTGGGILVGNAGGTGTIVYATGAWSVTFNAIVVSGTGIFATYSLTTSLSILTGDGTGTIDNTTGQFSATFNTAPASSATIYDNYQGYQPARPQGVLWFQNEFIFRPIPDQVYQIQMQGYTVVNQLLESTSTPTFTEWGQLIAYGAAFELFMDRGDNVAAERIYSSLKRYENIAIARDIQNYQSQQSVPRF